MDKIKILNRINLFYNLIAVCIIFSSCYKRNKVKPYNPPYLNIKLDPTRANVPDSLKHLLPILDSIFYADSKFRRIIPGDANSFIAMEKAFKENIIEAKKLDSANQLLVDSILNKYGWLGPKKISFSGYSAIFNTIQHAPYTYQIKYEPMIEKAMQKKEILYTNYTMFIDRLLMYQHKKQLYGTQVVYSKLLKQSVVYPLIDPINVDKRRDSIGYKNTPLKDYVANWKIIWNSEEYLKQLPQLEEEFKIEK